MSEGDTIFLLAGDTNLQVREDPASAFLCVSPLFRAADARFVNLEGPWAGHSDDPAAPDSPHKAGWRHSEPGMVRGLVAAGVDAVGCANNVTYPPSALLRSLAVLDGAGIAHTGGGSDDAAARDGVHALPRALPPPPAELVVDRLPGRELPRQQAPPAARAHQHD